MRLTSLAGLLVATAIGCGASAPALTIGQPSSEAPTYLPIGGVEYGKGETFRWKLVVGRLEAGRFWIRARDVNATTTRAVSGSESAGVARFIRHVATQAVTLIDRESGGTRTSLFERRSQGKLQRLSLGYTPDGIRGTIGNETGDSQAHARSSAGGLPPMNTETFLLGLRQWKPAEGDRAVAVVALRHLWLIELRAAEIRTIKTAMGDRLARRVVGTATYIGEDGTLEPSEHARPVTLWLSADEQHLPLRAEAATFIGTVVVELVDHRVEP